MHNTILFVTHRKKQCGVYEFGIRLFEAIKVSAKYHFVHAACDSLDELKNTIQAEAPIAIIYNYHPSVLPWICTKVAKGCYRNHISNFKPLQIGIIHEVTQTVADTATAYRNNIILGGSEKKLNALFDFYIAPDPTLLLQNPFVFKTGRLVPVFHATPAENRLPVIGSFGFATPNKGFELLVKKVQDEFDEAIIRINMPAASFGDADGSNAKRIAGALHNIVKKPGIQLQITHDYFNHDQLLQFLAANSLNAFLYEDKSGRGLSSAVDQALAVKKPVAVSGSPMFRHILAASPHNNADLFPLKDIMNAGFSPLANMASDWNAENMCWEFERIISASFERKVNPYQIKMGVKRKVQSAFNRILTLPGKSFTWLNNTVAATDDDLSAQEGAKYTPVSLGSKDGFNRILDDKARELYAATIAALMKFAPATMAKKITRANVQQAFVFDTVYRHLNAWHNPRLLCVGCYEDTASMALQKLGYDVTDIDPMVNYFLQEFATRPTTRKNSFDVIFSTSVIEHDPDDQSFMECIEKLLAPGGLAVITCDFKEGWLPGQPKPEVDARFYTKKDLEERLLSVVPHCELIDSPDWDCLQPDFNYLGKYQYTFATFTIRKKK